MHLFSQRHGTFHGSLRRWLDHHQRFHRNQRRSQHPALPLPPSDGTLKLILSTTDGSSTDDKVPIPWLNRTMPTNLMFRSLFIADSTLNEASPDLAESYEVSEDGLTYTIHPEGRPQVERWRAPDR